MSQTEGRGGGGGGGSRKRNGSGGEKGTLAYRKRPPIAAAAAASESHSGSGMTSIVHQPANGVVKLLKPPSTGTAAESSLPSLSPAKKKSKRNPPKKPQQQLKTISLGDLIKPNSLPTGISNYRRSRNNQSRQQQQGGHQQAQPNVAEQQQQQQTRPASMRDEEFPELSKSIGIQSGRGQEPATTKSSSLSSKPAWGAAANAPKHTALAAVPSQKEVARETPKSARRNNNRKKPARNGKSASTSPGTTNTSSRKQPKEGHPANKLILTDDPNVLRAGMSDAHHGTNFFPSIAVSSAKGKQRIKPRKKKFTTLKKRVLQERLNKWREAHPINDQPSELSASMATEIQESSQVVKTEWKDEFCSVGLYGFVHPEDDQVEDDDEYEELISNLRDMAGKVGPIVDVFIPRRKEYYCMETLASRYPVFVHFAQSRDAAAAISCWNGLVVGGQALEGIPLESPPTGEGTDPEDAWHAIMTKKGALSEGNVCDQMDCKPLTTIVLENLLTEDDLEDPDCLAETINDARCLVEPFCNVVHASASKAKSNWLEITMDCDEDTAKTVVAKLAEVVVAGIHLVARIKKAEGNNRLATQTASVPLVELGNILSPEDFEDEECLEESLDDVRNLASQFGIVSEIKLDQEKCMVSIAYDGGIEISENAAKHLDGMTLGGAKVSARVVEDRTSSRSLSVEPTMVILLNNILTEDDMEDKECLEESLNDVRELAMQFGKVLEVGITDQSENAGQVQVVYSGDMEVASNAVSGFNGMVVGGQNIVATILSTTGNSQQQTETIAVIDTGSGSQLDVAQTVVAITSTSDAATPMFSGGKRVPERFAECKRAPKIPNAGTPRHYAKVSNDETTKTLLLEMLEELMRLQRRAVEDKNAKARRRIVMGLREVARGIRAHKVKMVVMANNLDEYGAIDEKLQGILDLTAAEQVPVFFEFGKRALGKAVGKSIKVGVVGIQNSDGADQQFKKLVAINRKLEVASNVTPKQDLPGSNG